MVMYNVFKYSYFAYLEKQFNNKFKLCSGDIYTLPPIIKRIGLFFYVCFPVVNNNKDLTIKRPIGLICVNKHGKIKTYDFNGLDFCNKADFCKTYYSFLENNYWPNISSKKLEEIKIALQNLNKIYVNTNIITGYNETEYKKYLNKIKELFPSEFFNFYDLLQQNEIVTITDQIKEKRANLLSIYQKEETARKEQTASLTEKNKLNFEKELYKDLKTFIKEDVIPSFKDVGTYSKLLFYNLFGEYLKKIDINVYNNCYSPNLTKDVLQENRNTAINKLKVQIIKLYSKSIDTPYNTNLNIDTLSKILIVFLNSLLIEEKKGTYINNFEQEIKESKQIFNENIVNVNIPEAKTNLENFYKDLCDDYFQKNKKNFSNLFYSYLFIFN